MGEPITQKRLLNYASYKTMIENHLERLARMRSNEIMPAMRDGDGSQHTASASDRMANAIIKRLDYMETSAPRIEAALKEMEAIEKAVAGLADPMESEVLRLRYLDGQNSRQMPWTEVAMRIYGDDDEKRLQATYRAHGRALQSIRKVET